jgi:hypothetical protein
MLNFPDSPTLGQVFPPYTWDGEKWVSQYTPDVPLPGTAPPIMDGVATVGTQTKYSREDHRHPSDTTRLALSGSQTITGGFRFTAYNLGTISSGSVQFDAYNGNYQFYTNNGAHTWLAPANDCAIDILVTNGASAGSISVSGFTVGANIGDPITPTNGQRFIVSMRRMNGISTWVTKALQ